MRRRIDKRILRENSCRREGPNTTRMQCNTIFIYIKKGRERSSLCNLDRYSGAQRRIPRSLPCTLRRVDGTMQASQAKPSESSGENNDEIQDVSRNNMQLCNRHQEIDLCFSTVVCATWLVKLPTSVTTPPYLLSLSNQAARTTMKSKTCVQEQRAILQPSSRKVVLRSSSYNDYRA